MLWCLVIVNMLLKPVLRLDVGTVQQPKGKFPEWAPNSFLVDANHSIRD